MSFKAMENLIHYVIYLYRLGYSKPSGVTVLVDQSLNYLTKYEREFFQKEFFGDDSCWWYEYYSRSTYYRYKRKVMTKFVDYITHIV